MSATAPIVIAYDGSPPARQAIWHAASLAPGRHAIIVVARSAMDSVTARLEGHDAYTHDSDDAVERTAAQGVRLARAAGLDAEALVVSGNGSVGHSIIDAAERVGAALIVLGSRGRNGLRSLALGSVSRHVVHEGRIPTLVVPARPGRDVTSEAAARIASVA
jgi:nucleotide-binding universal stress UspA family protein